jgi:hypothetical protein
MTFLLGLMVGGALGTVMAALLAAGKIDDLRLQSDGYRKAMAKARAELLILKVKELDDNMDYQQNWEGLMEYHKRKEREKLDTTVE